MASIFVYTNWETRLGPTKDKMEATISVVSERDLKPTTCSGRIPQYHISNRFVDKGI
jgi:hypothetical protein